MAQSISAFRHSSFDMSPDSRRSSSSSSTNGRSGSQLSVANCAAGNGHPSMSRSNRSSSISRQINLKNDKKSQSSSIRRCQSMRNPNNNVLQGDGNTLNSGLQSSPSFKCINMRRPSNVSGLGNSEYGNNRGSPQSSEFVKYYQYKISKPELNIPFQIVIEDANFRPENHPNIEKGTKCRVLVLGYQSSGKTSLIRHFGRCAQDQCVSDYDDGDKSHESIHPNAISENNRNRLQASSVKSHCPKNLNQPLLIIKFKERTTLENFHSTSPNSSFHPDAYIIVYAVDSRDSFEFAKKIITEIYRWDDFESKSVILVANKMDLVRRRAVSKQEGRQLAVINNCKYIETSCTISHNVDFLLAGIGTQITLKKNVKQKSQNHQRNNSVKKPNIIKRFLNKTILNKSKSCDNLHVL
ncbi:uncharacterized protein LOC141856111 [Brevipalpus obovatus]|uniref:uncharacterized protein LOC141856111 n=1 Tax=Brevipalpus obovatus TaxID=246614 RepID=UPI003D9E6150